MGIWLQLSEQGKLRTISILTLLENGDINLLRKFYSIFVISLWFLSSCSGTSGEHTNQDRSDKLIFTPEPMSHTLSATAQFLWQTPEPLPEFIIGLYPQPGGTVLQYEKLGISIRQPNIGEETDSTYLKQHLKFYTHIMLDGEVISHIQNNGKVYPLQDISFEFRDGLPSMDNTRGSYSISIPLTNLQPGLHIATIQIITPDGKGLSYSWSFKVIE